MPAARCVAAQRDLCGGEVRFCTVRYARVVVAGAGTVVPRDLCPVLAVEQRVIGGHALIRRLGQRLHERFLLFESCCPCVCPEPVLANHHVSQRKLKSEKVSLHLVLRSAGRNEEIITTVGRMRVIRVVNQRALSEAIACEKRPLFSASPYVCPEPVLTK